MVLGIWILVPLPPPPDNQKPSMYCMAYDVNANGPVPILQMSAFVGPAPILQMSRCVGPIPTENVFIFHLKQQYFNNRLLNAVLQLSLAHDACIRFHNWHF